MKIKFKETHTPKISNIIFNLNHSKSKLSNQKNKKVITPELERKQILSKKQTYFFPNEFSQAKQEQDQLQKNCLLMKYKGFIPKNPNIKSVIFLSQRDQRPIKSLQSAKQQQKKFPMRKIIAKRNSFSLFLKKEKLFQFANPQIQAQIFKNKKISNSMFRSHSLFYSRKDLDLSSRDSQVKKTATFQRYDLINSMSNSSTNFSFRKGDLRSQKHRTLTRLSNPNL